MRAQEWMALVKENIESGAFALSQLPLGVDEEGEVVTAHRKNRQDRYFHTCVTGNKKTAFLMATVRSLAGLYGVGKATFFVLSPHKEYVSLLGVKGADVTVPYIRSREEFDKMKRLAFAEADARRQKPDYPKFFLVIDGIDQLPFLQKDNYLSLYREFIDGVAGGAEVLCGVDFAGTLFSGFPGAFVGVGNSLVSADEEGQADVTYVLDNCALDCPRKIEYSVDDKGE